MAKRWTADEDEVLRSNYAGCDIDTLARILPGRSIAGIHMRAHVLRLLKPERPPKPEPERGRGRPARQLPDPRKRKLVHLTVTEIQTLRELGSVLNMPELKMLIPRRSIAQILDTADDYGIRLKNQEYWRNHIDRLNKAEEGE